MSPLLAFALVVGIAASAQDLHRRQISNWICLAALAGGLALHINGAGWRGLADSALGAAGGFGVFLLFYLLGGMGGGDVKLMAGFGAVLGTGRLLEATLITSLCGGVMALLWILASRLRRALQARAGHPLSQASESIPYAPAISIGVWLTLLART
ncbi:MAG: A24 family peptidase [Bryobacteraceae bacterium]|nr:A24 family peptidase [Bryobacteraceae bacterium]